MRRRSVEQIPEALNVGMQSERFGHGSCSCKPCGVEWTGKPICWVCGSKVVTVLPFYLPSK